MRYEKKYTFSMRDLEIIRDDIKKSKLAFNTTFPDRLNHSIYFDSFNYDDAMENISGLSKRYKVRLRWYSEPNNFVIDEKTKFQLEIKLKRNALGEKIVHSINLPRKILYSTELNIINYITNQLPIEHRPYLNHCTNLSLGVFYRREYLMSKGIDIRATIDTEINYWNPRKINSR